MVSLFVRHERYLCRIWDCSNSKNDVLTCPIETEMAATTAILPGGLVILAC